MVDVEHLPGVVRERDAPAALLANRGHHRTEMRRVGVLDRDEGLLIARRRRDRTVRLGAASVLDERDLVEPRRIMRAAVEWIDAIGIPKADAAQELLDAARLRASLANDSLRIHR